MKAKSISIGDIMAGQTIEVEIRITGIRWFKFRFWLGTRLLKLAARVIGCGIEIKEPPCQG
jgi:hypothetical protein